MKLTNRIKLILPKNEFARNVSILAGGSAAGQAIIILASPLLTRLYTPADFGLLAVYAALVGILGVVASLRYQFAIPLPESDEEAARIVILGLLIVLIMSCLTSVILIILRQPLLTMLDVPEIAMFLWLLPLGLILLGFNEVFMYWAIRISAFPVMACAKFTQSISMVTVQLTAFFLGPLGLMIGHIFGQSLSAICLGLVTFQNRLSLFKKFNRRELGLTAARYRRFPIYSTWGGAFNTIGREMPSLLFATFFNISTAGMYMLAHRVIALPMNFIGRAIADVFFSKAAEAQRDGQLARLVDGTHKNLANLAMPIALVLMFAGPNLFAFAFGESWRQSGKFAQLMAPWLYFMFVTSPLSTLFFVTETQIQEVIFQGTLLTVRIVAVLVGAKKQDLFLAVSLFALASAFCYAGLLIWIIKRSRNTLTSFLLTNIRAFGWGLILITPLIVSMYTKWWLFTELIGLMVTMALVTLRYIFLIGRAWGPNYYLIEN